MNEKTNIKEVAPEIAALRDRIMTNCHRSDAHYAGYFSLCGLLLRLRDFYKWEHGLPPWIEADVPRVLAWIEERENFWEGLQDEEITPLEWRGEPIDPFEAHVINRDIIRDNFYYGSGYAAFMKPTFFLGRVVRRQTLGEYRVVYLGDELARDLFTAPAQTRGDEIVARLRPLAAYLWETIMHGSASRQRALEMALAEYGLCLADMKNPSHTWASKFYHLLEQEIDTYVWHEYGELTDRNFDENSWRAIVGANPFTRIELMARTIKDLLADTGENGRLKYIINGRRVGSLGLFMAQHNGLVEHLFPEIGPAYERFLREGSWDIIDQARQAAGNRAASMAREMVALSDLAPMRPRDWLAGQVEKIFYGPLGL